MCPKESKRAIVITKKKSPRHAAIELFVSDIIFSASVRVFVNAKMAVLGP